MSPTEASWSGSLLSRLFVPTNIVSLPELEHLTHAPNVDYFVQKSNILLMLCPTHFLFKLKIELLLFADLNCHVHCTFPPAIKATAQVLICILSYTVLNV